MSAAEAHTLTELARQQAKALGQSWATELKASIILERRRPCGGWPGIMSEARARVSVSLLPWLERGGQRVLTVEQREAAARLIYASARSTWIETREADDGI